MDRRAPEDYPEAVAWFRKTAEQGSAHAQSKLGYFYYSGYVVPQDYAQAAAWYRKAAEQGDATAEKNLGTLYYHGRGVPQDYAQAVLWYRKAAEQGNANAQGALGASYHDGVGVPKNYGEAYFWYDLAVAGKLDASKAKDASKYRDEAASHLTPADLSREQERARKWFEAHQAKP